MSVTDPSTVLRGAIAAGLLAVFGAGASWIVHREGQSYRDSLHADRRVESPRKQTPPQPPPPLDPGQEKTSSPSGPNAKGHSIPTGSSSSTTTKVTTSTTDELAKLSTPGRIPVGPIREPEVRQVDPPGPKPPTRGPEVVLPADSVWDLAAVKEVWDLDHFTVEDETQLGRALHTLILSLNQEVADRSRLGRVQEAADRLIRDAPTPPRIPYTFTVLESDNFNVFSHPGGFIYISRSLIDAIGDDEAYTLEFALAHEMAHLELGHALQCLRDPKLEKLASQGYGTLGVLYQIVIPYAYPEAMDDEADRWALARLGKLGRDRRKSLAFLRKLESYAEEESFSGGRVKPEPDPDRSVIDNHLRAHVSARSRLENAKKYLESRASKP